MIGTAESARSDIYVRLGTLLKGGLPLLNAIQRIEEQGGPGGRFFEGVTPEVGSGEELGQALAAAGRVSELEAQVLSSGYRSGALPESCEQLAELFRERAATKREAFGALAYPVFILHCAIFLPNIPLLLGKNGVSAYLSATFVPLLIAYVVIAGLVAGYRAGRQARVVALDRFLLALPVVGGIALKLSLVNSLRALSVLYRNGISVVEAIHSAGEVANNEVVRAAFERIERLLQQGVPLGEAFSAEVEVFPGSVRDMIATGSMSGQLDEVLPPLVTTLADDARRARNSFFAVLGVAAFLLVAAVVAYKVITFYTGMMNQAFKGR